MGKKLCAIADAQQRQTAPEGRQVHFGGIGVTHAAWTAGQYDTLHTAIKFRHFVIRENFAVDVQFPQPPSYELRDLRSKI